jgi:2-polyprenyl-3-methyl-5-hydroxy-6-metoxy-1,4-benzoquinol methylase
MNHPCNKYIINGDEFIRDFEKMYEEISDPWDQEKGKSLEIIKILNMIKVYKNPKTILDIGCATGYTAKEVLKLYTKSKYTGIDISETAIKKAKQTIINTNVKYKVDNIIIYNKSFFNKYDLILCNKTIYYCAPEIDVVINNIMSYLKINGIFALIYNETKDAFSNKWLTPEILLKKLKKLTLIEHCKIYQKNEIIHLMITQKL